MGSWAKIGVFGAKNRGSEAKIGGSVAKIKVSVAMFEVSWVKIGTKPGSRHLGPIFGHLGAKIGSPGVEGIIQATKSNLASRMHLVFPYIYFDK